MLNNSKIDSIYRSALLTKFFIKGFGEHLREIFNFRKILSNRETCQTLIDPFQPIYIDKCVEKTTDYNLYEGHFKSPLVDYLPVPEECKIARFQLIEPTKEKLKKINADTKIRPVSIHHASTGDHFYWRRRNFMCKPLLDHGITSIILENPYYGKRKPKNQNGSCLTYVEDIFLMGGCLVLENLVLLNWLERNNYGPLGVTGISLGGHMCSLAGCSWPKPISIVPCLSWTTASCVFTEGVLSGAIPWSVLEEQYKHFGDDTISELSKLIQSPEKNYLFHASNELEKQQLNEFKKFFPINQKEVEQSDDLFLLNDDGLAEKLNILNEMKNESSLEASKLNNKKSILDGPRKFMAEIMDNCTHLKNFDTPVDPQLCIIVTAEHDGYVPKSNLIALNQLWPGSQLRKIDAGHVTAIIFYHRLFQQAIVDSLDLNARKYYNSKILEKSFLDREELMFEQSTN